MLESSMIFCSDISGLLCLGVQAYGAKGYGPMVPRGAGLWCLGVRAFSAELEQGCLAGGLHPPDPLQKKLDLQRPSRPDETESAWPQKNNQHTFEN